MNFRPHVVPADAGATAPPNPVGGFPQVKAGPAQPTRPPRSSVRMPKFHSRPVGGQRAPPRQSSDRATAGPHDADVCDGGAWPQDPLLVRAGDELLQCRGVGAPVVAERVDYGPGLPLRIRALTAAPVDRALDVAGAGSLGELIELAGTADSVVTLADFGASAHGVRLSLGRFGGRPDGVRGLSSAAVLADQGRFRVPVRSTYPARQAAQAHAAAAQPPRQGKAVLDPTRSSRPS